jgi:hypothetical protein
MSQPVFFIWFEILHKCEKEYEKGIILSLFFEKKFIRFAKN